MACRRHDHREDGTVTMRYIVTKSVIQIIGTIWMPAVTAAYFYNLSTYDLDNIRAYGDGTITRDGVERWLLTNAGDFQHVQDFRADITDGDTDIVFDWASEESEFTYNDCMYGGEDE